MTQNKTNILSKSLWLVWVVVVPTVIFLMAVILIFVFNFYGTGLSSDISHWGATGDYIGGLINPFVAFLNLLVLGFLTYVVSKQSSEESKNIFMLQQKIEAYRVIGDHLPKINQIMPIFSRKADEIKYLVSMDKHPEINKIAVDKVLNLSEMVYTFMDFHYELYTFKARFSHVFVYSFDSDGYKRLLKESSNMLDRLKEYYDAIMRGKKDVIDSLKLNEEPLADALAELVNEIRKELK